MGFMAFIGLNIIFYIFAILKVGCGGLPGCAFHEPHPHFRHREAEGRGDSFLRAAWIAALRSQ